MLRKGVARVPLDGKSAYMNDGFRCGTARPDKLRVIVVEHPADLILHGAAWNALCAGSQDPVPRYSYTFFGPWLLQQLKPGEHWQCLFFYEGEYLIGAVPLIIRRVQNSGLARFRIGSSVKAEVRGWTILAAQGYEQAVASAVLAELERQHLDVFRLAFLLMHEHSTVVQLQDKLSDVQVVREDCGLEAYLKIQGDFATYFGGLDAHFRQNLRRVEKRFEELPSPEVAVLVGDQVQDQHFEQFLRLEASGWKGRAGTAIACDARASEFYRAWVRNLQEAGWLELHFLRSAGEPIAGLFAIHVGNTLTIWKTAYDERFSNCSAGNLLVKRAIQRAYSNGNIGEIAFLSDPPWLQMWRTSTRSYWNIYWYPRRLYSILFGSALMEARQALQELPGVRKLVGFARSSHAHPSDANTAVTGRD